MPKQLVTLVGLLLAGLTLLAAQCSAPLAANTTGPDGEALIIDQPRARMAGQNGAVYLNLINHTKEADVLLSAESDVAEAAELHESKMESEVMKMAPVEKIEIPAGGTAALEPGGLHIMLVGIRDGLQTGDSFDLTLTFEKAGTRTVEVMFVEQVEGAGDPNMDRGN